MPRRGARGGKRTNDRKGNSTQNASNKIVTKKEHEERKKFFDALDRLIAGEYGKSVQKIIDPKKFGKYISPDYERLDDLISAIHTAMDNNVFKGKDCHSLLPVLLSYVQAFKYANESNVVEMTGLLSAILNKKDEEFYRLLDNLKNSEQDSEIFINELINTCFISYHL